MDFVRIQKTMTNKGFVIEPKFVVRKSKDLMVRAKDFYSFWDEENKSWSTDEDRLIEVIDAEIRRVYDECPEPKRALYMWDASSGMIDAFHKYCQKQLRDNFTQLDSNLTFLDDEPKRELYSSKRLGYNLCDGSIDGYEKLVSTLYTPIERHKLEWCIGSIISGDSKKLQKFAVLYGSHGTGKSTMLNIIEMLFDGYYCTFDAQALGNRNNTFALEPFSKNPLVGIQHDGDLSRIEDNTRINSLVSHEYMSVNEKYKGIYGTRFQCFLFMGTNKPVKITDAKSGIIRRLIDITPSGEKLSKREYDRCMKSVSFELGAIARHCLDVYMDDPNAFDNYIPLEMIGSTNDFFNFVEDAYSWFESEPYITLQQAFDRYKTYCDEGNFQYALNKRVFKEELKNYFESFEERTTIEGIRMRNIYRGFLKDKFESLNIPEEPKEEKSWLTFGYFQSSVDKECGDCPAQYANDSGVPSKSWDRCKTKLRDIDTEQLHYVRLPEQYIVIDLDIPGPNGEKSLDLNIEAAKKFPPTYAELSKSGNGIHLHYIYDGDVTKLADHYDEKVEIKVFTGKSSCRRKLGKSNGYPIVHLSGGLPLRKEKAKKVVEQHVIKDDEHLRNIVIKHMRKEIMNYTKPSIEMIKKLLDEAYESGMKYDLTDLETDLMAMAYSSTHNSRYCRSVVRKMKLKSEDEIENKPVSGEPIPTFYDVEVFPNLVVVCYSRDDEEEIHAMINPSSSDIEFLFGQEVYLTGFNCRKYDNHIIWGVRIGEKVPEDIYRRSKAIIGKQKGCFFGPAYNVSYTDIYDYASAGNKKSLKALEIEMGQTHLELGLDWDQPVDPKLWPKVVEYCKWDVKMTKMAHHYLKNDWMARCILSDLAGLSRNDTTNTLTTAIIFGGNKHPQNEFHYRNLAEPVQELDKGVYMFLEKTCPKMMAQRHGEANSILPYFPGYKFEYGKSTYKGIEVGEGGRVFARPGIWYNVGLFDITSQHPHSTIAECLFGPRYTQAYYDIVYGRVHIKHQAWELMDEFLDGKLKPYIQRVLNGELSHIDLANALKTAINSVYGLTAAGFENPFKHPDNVDNIVAKRGALFMIDLQEEVEKRGFTVVHIKTDSIKIANPNQEIIDFVMEFGAKYGYYFEHEATYERMCLVNNAVYIAKYSYDDVNGKHKGQWTATGTQFQVPYVFKTLFSHEDIQFTDLCVTNQVKTAIYLDMNEGMAENEHNYQFIGKIGQFTPIKPGCGGGELMVKRGDDKWAAVTGSKGYRWMESRNVQLADKMGEIDISYFESMAEDARKAIGVYGSFEDFVSDETWPDEVPF